MLKKTLIALAAVSSLSMIVPAQAQGWGGYAEGHVSHSPSIRFVISNQVVRQHERYDRYDRHHYRHYDRGHHYGSRHGRGHGWERDDDRRERGYGHGDRH